MSTVGPARKKLSREAFPPDAVLCDHCWAKCCRYFALPIDTPKNRKDLVPSVGSCSISRRLYSPTAIPGIYWSTPTANTSSPTTAAASTKLDQRCREYSMKDCEFDDDWLYERYFETSEQVEDEFRGDDDWPAGESIRRSTAAGCANSG